MRCRGYPWGAIAGDFPAAGTCVPLCLLGKYLEMYAELAGVPQNTLRLFLDGNRLLDEQTPVICRLEDGDEIYVMAEMLGD